MSKLTTTQHAAQAPIRKARRAANQRRADSRLARLLSACEKRGVTSVGEPEYRFHTDRRWRFDYAWSLYKIAIEIDGGQWQVTGRDLSREAERNNEAQIAGWCVLHFTSEQIDKRVLWCAEQVKRAFDVWWRDNGPVLELPISKQTPISGSAAIRTRKQSNAAAISAAHNALPDMLDALDAAEKRADEAEDKLLGMADAPRIAATSILYHALKAIRELGFRVNPTTDAANSLQAEKAPAYLVGPLPTEPEARP